MEGLGVHFDVDTKRVKEAPRAPMKADDSTVGFRELECGAFLCPIRPKSAPIAGESKRSHNKPAIVIASVPFHTSEVLVRLQTYLDMKKTI